MKLKNSAIFLILLVFLLALAPISSAQSANTPPTNQNNITKETDHLPLMKNEQAPESQEPGTGSLLIKTLGAMLLIVGLIFFGAWGLKKFGFGVLKPNAASDSPDLAILSSVSLGSGRTISTIQFGERVLLVGSTAQSFTLLADESGGEVVSSDNSPRSVAEMLDETNSSFDDKFAQAQNKFNFPLENGGRV